MTLLSLLIFITGGATADCKFKDLQLKGYLLIEGMIQMQLFKRLLLQKCSQCYLPKKNRKILP
jgi:hypothetical protein